MLWFCVDSVCCRLEAAPKNNPISQSVQQKLSQLLSDRDALLVADAGNTILFSHQPDRQLIPASILKLLTALTALHELGLDHRFQTHFFVDDAQSLTIQGFGDPRLTSKQVARFCRKLASQLSQINHIRLDDSFFTQPLTIPGVSNSYEPYDAPNGALCVNFNTVFFKKEANGQYVSAEPETPLLPLVLPRIRHSGLSKGRIVLSSRQRQHLMYAGHLFRYFLRQAGIAVHGRIEAGRVHPDRDRRLYQAFSETSMGQIIEGLMHHSNNFTANQLLISAGVRRSGPPGNLPKGVATLKAFASEHLGLKKLTIAEGSGISRKNRISAAQMMPVVQAFAPHRHWLPQKENDRYKTGTLKGVRSRVGFLKTAGTDDAPLRYVLICNRPQAPVGKIMHILQNSARSIY